MILHHPTAIANRNGFFAPVNCILSKCGKRSHYVKGDPKSVLEIRGETSEEGVEDVAGFSCLR